MGNFKEDQSIEEVLRQQIEKKEYFDDGSSGGKPPRGNGGSGGDGSGGSEDEGVDGVVDETIQVILATLGFIVLVIFSTRPSDLHIFVLFSFDLHMAKSYSKNVIFL